MMEFKKFAPGEKKLLYALIDGPKSFTELKNDTMLPGSVLSDYLKRLQDKDLIARDFRTRKYEIKECGIQEMERMRLLNDHFDDLNKLSFSELKEELARYQYKKQEIN